MFACVSAPEERRSVDYPSLVGKRILVIDDEPVICVDYWFQLREIGALPEAFRRQTLQLSASLRPTRSMP